MNREFEMLKEVSEKQIKGILDHLSNILEVDVDRIDISHKSTTLNNGQKIKFESNNVRILFAPSERKEQ